MGTLECQRAVVMGLDHPSGLAEGPLRPDLHAGMDAQMNKWKDRRRQKSGVMIRAAGTMCWKHGDGKHTIIGNTAQLRLGLFVVDRFKAQLDLHVAKSTENLRVDRSPGPGTYRVVTALT